MSAEESDVGSWGFAEDAEGCGGACGGQTVRLKVVRMSLVFREAGPTSAEQPSDFQCVYGCEEFCRPEPAP